MLISDDYELLLGARERVRRSKNQIETSRVLIASFKAVMRVLSHDIDAEPSTPTAGRHLRLVSQKKLIALIDRDTQRSFL